MKTLLMTTMVLSIFLMLGANQKAQARSHFSLYLGGPNYVTQPYYVAPQPYYYVAPQPHYYVAPQPHYYVAPQQNCYRVYDYTPFGRVYHTECY